VSLENDIIDLMARAEEQNVTISEITLSQVQVDYLADTCGGPCFPSLDRPTIRLFNGARIVVRSNRAQSLASQLRALAKKVEDLP
jgi:hypothetical protein